MVWATPEGATEEAFTRFREETTARAADGHEAVFGIFDAGHRRRARRCRAPRPRRPEGSRSATGSTSAPPAGAS